MPAFELPSLSEDLKMDFLRKRVKDHHLAVKLQTKDKYQDVLAELFFLQNGGNMMDFGAWKKKPPPTYLEYVKSQPIEVSEDKNVTPITTPEVLKAPVTTLTSSAPSTIEKTSCLPSKTSSASLPGLVRSPSAAPVGRPPAVSAMTPEQIVEKAKQEAYVVQRISELQRDGMWTEKRLPKVVEPVRPKSHWDFLLEEMLWLSADFAQERKWKKTAARKCGRMILKHFQDKATAAAKAEKEEEQRLRKTASFVAKEIRTFWSNVEKFAEFKQNVRLDEKRKKVIDQQLNFIVNETEKYSTLLTEGTKISQETTAGNNVKVRESDDEFEPDDNISTDDEETIALEETIQEGDATSNSNKEKDEVEALKRESEIPLEDLLDELPAEYLESIGKTEIITEEEKLSDDEFEVDSDDDEEDDEETIDQAEKEDGDSKDNELEELEAEKDMPLEKILAKYSGKPVNEDEAEEEEKMDESNDDEGLTGESESDMDFEEDSKDVSEKEPIGGLGIESLLEDSTADKDVATSKLSDAAALAESFQPKGNTLESTQVVAKVPFLLKHSLREYQHIGLDWMAAMYERKLNGILADEMGLGKTIQTIGLLAWLACEKGIWGPHLVVVPTSVMLNWEMEFKKWCPSFKILTYYGSQKDRRIKRTGWTKPNAFHVCITSYKLVIQDHQAFRRKRWRYFILDEAQNIKNFKSQRWQLLLNFQSQRRLLLTGTPLQNNLMELWSLMHFLMPDIFGSHRDFREWFSNPVTGMIEGNAEYNESIIRRLHKVLRPFILRRLKSEVEKQMPKKFEHIVMCRLSKRQRYLYEDFMSKARTKETLASGNLLSVMNVLMQLRKVCNHPNLFEPRAIASPFQMEPIVYHTASLVYGILDYDPFEHANLANLNLMLADLETTITAFAAHRIRKFEAPPHLIQEIDSAPPAPPLCPRGKIRLHVRPANPQQSTLGRGIPMIRPPAAVGGVSRSPAIPAMEGGVASTQQPRLAAPAPSLLPSAAATSGAATRPPVQLQLFQQSGSLHVRMPSNSSGITTQRVTLGGDGRMTIPSFNNSVSHQTENNPSTGLVTPGQRIVLRIPISMGDNMKSNSTSLSLATANSPARMLTTPASSTPKQNGPEHPADSKRFIRPNFDRSIFKNNPLLERKRLERRERLAFLAKLNQKRCEACPIYGSDLIEAVTMTSRSCTSPVDPTDSKWHGGGQSYVHCLHAVEPMVGRRNFETLWSETNTLRSLVHTPEQYIDELRDIIDRFVVCAPAVTAPRIQMHTSHPPPSKLWAEQRREFVLQSNLSPMTSILHPIQSAMMTQFPDPRLIQYDCGKLQTLDKLLRQLKVGKHRVLIFTQMTRMLDVLEAFLNYHGHIYLRLDGTTKIEQRQVLMERFNADRRIFCFILSTRSGGVGVNLTGADTVIFYDSDWNPTMDAQAQDRCHRIGQTRDVHIYRLISERTVEENILKKANQKRMLGDIAIEGGNFNPTFKKQTIHDLFEVDVAEADASKRMAEVLDRTRGEQPSEAAENAERSSSDEAPVVTNKSALLMLENALAAAEDETDVAAAKILKDEVAAELDEFDETAPITATEDTENGGDGEFNKTRSEVQQIEHQLSPIERYALRFLENSEACWSAEQLRAAEAQIEEQKKAWELRRLAAMTGNDDERSGFDPNMSADLETGGLLTYSHQDSVNQVKKKFTRGRNNLNHSVVDRSLADGPSPAVVQRRRRKRTADVGSSVLKESDDSFLVEAENDASRSQTPLRETPVRRKRTRSSAAPASACVTPEVSLDDDAPPPPPVVNTKHSPRTRSRGSVNINLWTLDEKPMLPCPKPLANKTNKDGTVLAEDGGLSNGFDSENVPIKRVKIVSNADLIEPESDLDVVS